MGSERGAGVFLDSLVGYIITFARACTLGLPYALAKGHLETITTVVLQILKGLRMNWIAVVFAMRAFQCLVFYAGART